MPKTFYLCGAGGKGNVGAEAILLSIIQTLERRYEDARFVVTSWYPDRIRDILAPLGRRGDVVRREGVFADPRQIAGADLLVVCGDVAITESVVPMLPFYNGLRTLTAGVLGTPALFLGIEAETVRRPMNRLALRHLIDRRRVVLVPRNRQSEDILNAFPVEKARVLPGCDPVLMLRPEDVAGFDEPLAGVSETRPLVGFGVRDFFSRPLRIDWRTGRLVRSDAPPGQVTLEMERMIDFTAKAADTVVSRYGAQAVFIPHHNLPEGERVILPDRVIADRIVQRMKHPDGAVILEDDLHPYRLIHFYGRLRLVFSMRHHANAFALVHQIPTFGYAISEKLVAFFEELGQADMLLDPLSRDFAPAEAKIDRVLTQGEEHSQALARGLANWRTRMNAALDALGDL